MPNLSDGDITADLHCEFNGRPLSVRAAGGKIVVEIPDLATGLHLLRFGSPRGSLYEAAQRLRRFFEATATGCEVRLDGQLIGSAGLGVRSFLGRVLGLPTFRLSPVALTTAFMRQRRSV